MKWSKFIFKIKIILILQKALTIKLFLLKEWHFYQTKLIMLIFKLAILSFLINKCTNQSKNIDWYSLQSLIKTECLKTISVI